MKDPREDFHLIIPGILLVGTGDARSLTDSLSEKNLQLVLNGDQLDVRKTLPQGHEPEERVGALATSIAMSLLMGLIRDMIRDTIFGILGITTTTTTTVAPCGGLLGTECSSYYIYHPLNIDRIWTSCCTLHYHHI